MTICATLFGIADTSTILKTSQLFVTYTSDSLSSAFGIFRSFTNHYLNSANGQISSVFSWMSNPHIDIDLTTNTDCEDMLAFFGDIVEFAEQDKALFVDAAFDMWFNLNWSSAVFVFEAVLLTQLRRKTLSIFLAKFFNA